MFKNQAETGIKNKIAEKIGGKISKNMKKLKF